MSVLILRGDARRLPLADDSVDLVVTSPPYYALRSYTDGGQHYDGQIGAEPTPSAYIDNLIACTAEWMRVLKPSGSIWVNLGDKYNSAASGQNLRDAAGKDGRGQKVYAGGRGQALSILPTKSLMGLPWRYAIRCVDDLGLILRAEVIWSKPNGLPESVTDRVRRSHEQWFHLVKQPRYYAAIDRIRQPASGYRRPANYDRGQRDGSRQRSFADTCNPLGALPASVWDVATQPLAVPDHLGVDHFAAFPMEWPRRIIQGWSPEGICTACGAGRRPVSRRGDQPVKVWDLAPTGTDDRAGHRHGLGRSTLGQAFAREVTGEACACPDSSAPARPAAVLDPFGGTGTTALVAHALGRTGISADMSADYCRLAQWRTSDPEQLAAALQVDKPAKQLDGQDDLLALLADGPVR